jgi:septal ring factor EnvC (AmiA/AmiB activator)
MHTKLTLQMKEMQSLQGALSNQQEQISINSSRQERLLRESEYEQQNIRNILVEQKKKLESVRLSKEEVQKLIVKKEQSARQLSGLISSMVRNDIVKKEEKTSAEKPTHLQEKKRLGETPKKTSDIVFKKETQSEEPQRITQSTVQTRNDNTRVESLSGSFSGGFRWPSSAKRILRGFGQYKNSVTNTVMDNPGLDIACQAGSSAMCAATGIVSLVHWLPGYNSMVIVDHGNSYRTVYANLASISVKKGQKIEAGGLIGRTTQSVDGEFLHFEIWKGKQRMNPMAFLR